MSEFNQDNRGSDETSGRPGRVTPSADIALGKPIERPDEGQGYILCPYCGHIQKVADRCHDCGGLFEPLSRMATQIHMGPWFVRDKNNPFKPGCSYEVLVKQVKAGKIKRTTVLRGPTTCQFWALARNVPGIAHYLGVCHECNMEVSPDDTECSACKAKFEHPADRNGLGLMYRTEKEHVVAKKVLDRELAKMSGQPLPEAASSVDAGVMVEETGHFTQDPAVQAHRLPGLDLLDEVVGKSVATDQRTTPASTSASVSAPAPGKTAAAPARTSGITPPPPVADDADYAVDSPLDAPEGRKTKTVVSPGRSPDRTAPLPKKKGWDKVIIAWIIINIIVFGAVIAAVAVLLGDKEPADTGMLPPESSEKYEPQLLDDDGEVTLFDTDQESVNPHTGKQRNLTGDVAKEVMVSNEAEAEQLPDVSRPAAIMPPARSVTPSSDTPGPQSMTPRPVNMPRQPAAAVSQAAPQDATKNDSGADSLAVEDEQLNLRAAARLAQAQRLEDQGQFKQALALLEDAHGALPELARPASLDLAIMRIRTKIARDEARSFFGDAI